jgi:hypothetical protein
MRVLPELGMVEAVQVVSWKPLQERERPYNCLPRKQNPRHPHLLKSTHFIHSHRVLHLL